MITAAELRRKLQDILGPTEPGTVAAIMALPELAALVFHPPPELPWWTGGRRELAVWHHPTEGELPLDVIVQDSGRFDVYVSIPIKGDSNGDVLGDYPQEKRLIPNVGPEWFEGKVFQEAK